MTLLDEAAVFFKSKQQCCRAPAHSRLPGCLPHVILLAGHYSSVPFPNHGPLVIRSCPCAARRAPEAPDSAFLFRNPEEELAHTLIRILCANWLQWQGEIYGAT